MERAFSRLKGQRSLNHITVRKLRKVTLQRYLSLIAMQAAAVIGKYRSEPLPLQQQPSEPLRL